MWRFSALLLSLLSTLTFVLSLKFSFWEDILIWFVFGVSTTSLLLLLASFPFPTSNTEMRPAPYARLILLENRELRVMPFPSSYSSSSNSSISAPYWLVVNIFWLKILRFEQDPSFCIWLVASSTLESTLFTPLAISWLDDGTCSPLWFVASLLWMPWSTEERSFLKESTTPSPESPDQDWMTLLSLELLAEVGQSMVGVWAGTGPFLELEKSLIILEGLASGWPFTGLDQAEVLMPFNLFSSV